MLYVTLTTPGTSVLIRSPNRRNVAKDSSVGVAVTASVLFWGEQFTLRLVVGFVLALISLVLLGGGGGTGEPE